MYNAPGMQADKVTIVYLSLSEKRRGNDKVAETKYRAIGLHRDSTEPYV